MPPYTLRDRQHTNVHKQVSAYNLFLLDIRNGTSQQLMRALLVKPNPPLDEGAQKFERRAWAVPGPANLIGSLREGVVGARRQLLGGVLGAHSECHIVALKPPVQ